MFRRLGIGLVLAVAGVAAWLPGVARIEAQGAAALTGTVSSQAEGKMEGVLVTARRDGANFDVTVVSGAGGTYSFPRTHLATGKYTLKIRASGHELVGASTVDVPQGKTATLDLTLDKAKDLTTHLTTAEWLETIPGTDTQKAMMQRHVMTCSYCHSIERIVKSKHNAEQWVRVINRMESYYYDGTVSGVEGRGRAVFLDKAAQEANAKSPMYGYTPGVKKTDLAAYLATINQSGGRSLPADLKRLPRPKGKATRVIVTQYDLPRKETVPHDSDIDSRGNLWYNDQSDYFIGMIDAKTGTFKEWPVPKPKNHPFGGVSDVAMDRNGRAWFSVTSDKWPDSTFGQPGRFDPLTGKWTPVPFDVPTDLSLSQQFNSIAADGSVIFGKYKIDAETMKLLDTFEWEGKPNVPAVAHGHMIYETGMDTKGHWYGTDFDGSYIVKIDAKTKEVKWLKTPTPNAMPRRGRMDDQDRFWFAEYTADKVGMIDGKTEKIREYDLGVKWASPYAASATDGKGRAYAASGASDRVYQVDAKTGEVVAFLMPTRDFDSKELSIDPIGKKAVWLANMRNARIIKIEPLD